MVQIIDDIYIVLLQFFNSVYRLMSHLSYNIEHRTLISNNEDYTSVLDIGNSLFDINSLNLTTSACHNAHNISTGCRASLSQATNGVTLNVPNVKGASIIIWICTGKKASSSKQMPSAQGRRVNLNISITPNNISSIPDRVFINTGNGI
jgi:hypothetical protein